MSTAKTIPETIDRYQIKKILGTGAMGNVYAAWDPKLQREVAIKVIEEQTERKGKGRERFEREARAMAAVQHPNIIEIFDYSGAQDAIPYVVIEKLEGEDLFDLMNRANHIPESVAAAIAHELCLALEAAHQAGIVHRDIKPENVFMHKGGRVVLMDFGIVKPVRADTTVRGFQEKTQVIGTPGFMSPEQMRNEELGPFVDVYALGVLLYNIVTDRMPFEGKSPLAIYYAAQRGFYDDPKNYSPGLSDLFCSIIRSCLQPSLNRRIGSAKALRIALKQVLDEQGVGDVREEINSFVENPEAARRRIAARSVWIQARKLKVADVDHDGVALNQARERLAVLDPNHTALKSTAQVTRLVFGLGTHRAFLAQFFQKQQAKVRALVLWGKQSLQRKYRSMPVLAWGFACALLLVFTATGYQVIRPEDAAVSPHTIMAQQAQVHMVVPNLLARAEDNTVTPIASVPHAEPVISKMTYLSLKLRSGMLLSLDGQRIRHQVGLHFWLTPGRHIIRYGMPYGHVVRRIVQAAPNERVNLDIRWLPRAKVSQVAAKSRR